jgi:putative nucleotidyltransferase with HDIG domain
MRIVSVASLEPQQTVGLPLVDLSGAVMLQSGIALSEELIRVLRQRGYRYLYIREPDDDPEMIVESNIAPLTRAKSILNLHKTFSSVVEKVEVLRQRTEHDIKDILSSESFRDLAGAVEAQAGLNKVADEVLNDALTRTTVSGLANMRCADAELYDHSLEVCSIAVMIGKTLKLPRERLEEIARGALMHDVGKLFAPPTTDPATAIKDHTELGYALLRNTEGFGVMEAFAALEHHEYQDGTGLPRGTKGKNKVARDRSMLPPIPTLIGEIVAIANRYDHLLSGRGEDKGLPPEQVVITIKAETGTKWNKEIVKHFLGIVPMFPLGCPVVFINGAHAGCRGWVSHIAPDSLERPTVTLARDAAGNRISPIRVNLAEHPDIEVKSQGL